MVLNLGKSENENFDVGVFSGAYPAFPPGSFFLFLKLILKSQRAQEVDALRNEIEEYRLRCASEAQKIKDDVEAKVRNLDIMEREAIDALKV